MAELGCLKDGKFQNLECLGQLVMAGTPITGDHNLVVGDVSVDGLTSNGDLTVLGRLTALQGATMTYLNALNASMTKLNASNASMTKLFAPNASMTHLYASNASMTKLNASNASMTKLNASNASMTYLNVSGSMTTVNLTCPRAVVYLNASKVESTNLKQGRTVVTQLDSVAETGANSLNASNASLAGVNVNASFTIDGDLNASNASMTYLNATNASITHHLNATNASITHHLNASNASMTKLNASNASMTHLYVSGEITTRVLHVKGALNVAASASFAITSASLTGYMSSSSYVSNKAVIEQNLNASNASMTHLNASNASITHSLRAINASMTHLNASNASMTHLNATNASITHLNASNASLSQLNASNASMTYLYATNASITHYLNATNASITHHLNASNASMTHLNATNASITHHLNASNASMTKLNASNASLTHLNASNASIARLNASNASMTYLNASNASMTYLNASNASITHLNASNAIMTHLYTTNASITHHLNATNASITHSLSVTNASMTHLNASNASLTHLNASNATMTHLNVLMPLSLTHLNASNASMTYLNASNASIDRLNVNGSANLNVYTGSRRIISTRTLSASYQCYAPLGEWPGAQTANGCGFRSHCSLNASDSGTIVVINGSNSVDISLPIPELGSEFFFLFESPGSDARSVSPSYMVDVTITCSNNSPSPSFTGSLVKYNSASYSTWEAGYEHGNFLDSQSQYSSKVWIDQFKDESSRFFGAIWDSHGYSFETSDKRWGPADLADLDPRSLLQLTYQIAPYIKTPPYGSPKTLYFDGRLRGGADGSYIHMIGTDNNQWFVTGTVLCDIDMGRLRDVDEWLNDLEDPLWDVIRQTVSSSTRLSPPDVLYADGTTTESPSQHPWHGYDGLYHDDPRAVHQDEVPPGPTQGEFLVPPASRSY